MDRSTPGSHADAPQTQAPTQSPPPPPLPLPLGEPLPHWRPPVRPLRAPIAGRFCRLEPVVPHLHAAPLHAAFSLEPYGRMWTYLPYGPFTTESEYRVWLESMCLGDDPLFFTIIDLRRDPGPAGAVGLAAYLRITPDQGSIEVGHLAYSPLLQRTPAATEAMFLLMRHAFDLGYRRYEWKCNALNEPSRSAALRLGFQFEGLFRQAAVVRGRNRDTAWYSIIDSEWPTLRSAFERWLAPENFDATGRQRASLASLRATSPLTPVSHGPDGAARLPAPHEKPRSLPQVPP